MRGNAICIAAILIIATKIEIFAIGAYQEKTTGTIALTPKQKENVLSSPQIIENSLETTNPNNLTKQSNKMGLGQTLLGAGNLILLAITVLLLFYYTLYTKQLAKSSGKQTQIIKKQTNRIKESNILSYYADVHTRFNSDKSCEARRLLHKKNNVGGDIQDGLISTFIKEAIKNKHEARGHDAEVNIEFILSGDCTQEYLDEAMHKIATSPCNFHAKERIEQALNDFDLLAIPISLSLDTAYEIAIGYRSIIIRTAEPLLLYIAMQKRIRNTDDRFYKEHYLQLLIKILNYEKRMNEQNFIDLGFDQVLDDALRLIG